MLTGKKLGEAITEAVRRKIAAGGARSKADIARVFGVKPPSLSDWEKKGTIAKDKLPLLFDYFSDVCGPDHWDIPSGWMDQNHSGGGDATDPARIDGVPVFGHEHSMEDSVIVPMLDVRASMGNGEHRGSETVTGVMPLSRRWIESSRISITDYRNLRTITAFGDSMVPTFNSGDILLVDAGVRAIDVDGVYVLAANDQLYVKRVSRSMSGALVVSSDNPSVKITDDLGGDLEVEVLGRVVYAWNGRAL